MKRVYLTCDEDGHNYIIPYELKDKFLSYSAIAYETDDFELFEEQFGQYATGGDYNQDETPIYADI